MRKLRDHLPFLRSEHRALALLPMTLAARDALAAVLTEGDPEADEACRCFSTTLGWPEMTDSVRLQVCLRLDCAGWYCTQFGEWDSDDADWSGSSFLVDLLVEYWHEGGRSDWLQFLLRTAEASENSLERNDAISLRETFFLGERTHPRAVAGAED